MDQTIKRNDVPMFLVAVVRRFLQILVAGIELDTAEGVAGRNAAIGIDACFTDRLRQCRRCGACGGVAVELDPCVGEFLEACNTVLALRADDVVDDGWKRSALNQCVWVHALPDDRGDGRIGKQLGSERFANRTHLFPTDDGDCASRGFGAGRHELEVLDRFELIAIECNVTRGADADIDLGRFVVHRRKGRVVVAGLKLYRGAAECRWQNDCQRNAVVFERQSC